MDAAADLFRLLPFLVLLVWMLVDFLKPRRDFSEQQVVSVMPEIVVIFNILISALYIGSLAFKAWNSEAIPMDPVFLALSWIIVTFFTIYNKGNANARSSGWPCVLISWWVLSGIFQLFSIIIYLTNHFNLSVLPSFLPAATVADLVSFPFSVFLCIGAFSMNFRRVTSGIEQPILLDDYKNEDASGRTFSIAGIWRRLTFRWLNPVFEKGWLQRLELHHVPQLLKSEAAETAYFMLQESLRRDKSEFPKLTRAIMNVIWRPLVLNAALAGINTVASYLCLYLITNFVDFLSNEDEKRSHAHGYVLAFTFFFAKMGESLSQRHWYFGARQIGIRVRAALMVSLYKKAVTIKYSRLSGGKIINFLDVDVERIGDFFWYINGIWLLPVQVTVWQI